MSFSSNLEVKPVPDGSPDSGVPELAGAAARSRAETRRRLLEAGTDLFARVGLHRTTSTQIARAAGVAAGTVYLYFSSKADLFVALHERLFDLIDRAVREAPVVSPDMPEATRSRIHAVFAACNLESDLLRLVFLNFDPRSQVARKMRRGDRDRMRPLANLLSQGMEAGTVRQGDAMLLAHLITAAVSVALHQCFVVGDGAHASEYEDIATRMVIGALEPP